MIKTWLLCTISLVIKKNKKNYQIDSKMVSFGFLGDRHQLPCELCIKIHDSQQVEISIDPRGYLNGPVSIELVQIK